MQQVAFVLLSRCMVFYRLSFCSSAYCGEWFLHPLDSGKQSSLYSSQMAIIFPQMVILWSVSLAGIWPGVGEGVCQIKHIPFLTLDEAPPCKPVRLALAMLSAWHSVPNFWRHIHRTSMTLEVHSGTPGPMAPGTLKQTKKSLSPPADYAN